VRRLASALGELLVTGTFVLVVAVLVLAATPFGTALLVPLVPWLTAGRVAVAGAGGTLLGTVTADAVTVSLDTVAIRLDGVVLDVAWPALAGGELRLRAASAARLAVHVTPDPDAPDEPVAPLVLPLAIAADDLRIGTLAVQVRAEPETVLADLRLTGRLADGDLDFSDLGARYAGIALTAAGRFGTGEPFPLAAALTLAAPEVAVTGTGRLSGSLAELALAATLAVPEPVRVDGSARLLDERPSLALRLAAPRVSRALDDGTVVVLAGLAAEASGWLDDFAGELATTVAVAGYPAGRLTAAVRGNTDALAIERFTLAALGGRTTGSGRIALAPPVALDLRFAARGLDPAALDARASGRVNATGTLAVAGDGDLTVDLARADGVLLGRALAASGGIDVRDGEVRARAVRVAAGANRLELDGTWGATLAGRFRVEAPDLAGLWPGLAGRLRGSGTVGGTPARPTLAIDLDGADLAVGDTAVGSLRVRGGILPREGVDVTLSAGGLAAGGLDLGRLDARVDGRLRDHAVDLRLAGGEATLAVAARGGYADGRWSGTLATAGVTLPGAITLDLTAPVAVTLAAAAVSVEPHCWAVADGRLCLAATRVAGAEVTAGGELRDLPLAAFAPWLPAGISAAGVIAADVTARRVAGRWTGRLLVTPRDVVLAWSTPDDEPVRVSLEAARAEIDASEESLAFAVTLAEATGLRLEAEGEVTEPFGAEPGVAATLRGGIPDLAPLSDLAEQLADIADLSGRLTLDARLSGRLRAPTIDGGLELADAAFGVPAAGVTVDRIGVTVTGAEPGRAAIRGAARVGQGEVRLGGDLRWDEQFVPVATLAIQGESLKVIDIPEADLRVSPDVAVDLVGGQFRVRGEVLVPYARIRPRLLDAGAVAPSPDTIVHGRSERAVVAGRPLVVLDGVRVRLGRDVRFEGLGLRSDVTGGIALYQNLPDDPFAVTGDGVLQLENGKFEALGQVLDIERGSLRFAGLVTDPGIDVKASRQIVYTGRTVTAGVVLSGRLSRIETKVYSEPAMGEMDALSYLTTGRPLADASAGDRFSVANAALTLGMRGAMPIAQQLGDAIRVDELGVEGAGGENTAVFVGERFGDDLYVRYSYGIFDQVGTIRATYRIGRRLSIEGSSGQAQALDLIYSITW
jgi:translocation and assembly module TamB